MIVEQFNREKKGHFSASESGVEAGRMTYSWAGPEKFIIDHTEVSPAFSGRGVGKMLVMAAVEYARKNHLKIVPLCPFAKSVFEKDAELGDVLF